MMYNMHRVKLVLKPRSYNSKLRATTVVGVHDANAEDEFLGVVVVEDTVEVVTKAGRYLLTDLLHRQLLVRHALPVQLDSD